MTEVITIEKRTICKEVKFSSDEWNRLLKKAEKCGMLTAVYIRDSALNGKILFCDVFSYDEEIFSALNKSASAMNKVAKTVNTEKCVFLKDVEEAEKAVSMLGDIAENMLVQFTFEELK